MITYLSKNRKETIAKQNNPKIYKLSLRNADLRADLRSIANASPLVTATGSPILPYRTVTESQYHRSDSSTLLRDTVDTRTVTTF